MYIPAQHVSSLTRDLTAALRATIDAHQRKHPKTSADEIRAALAAVTPGTRYTPAWRLAVFSTVMFCLTLFGAFVAAIEHHDDRKPIPWIVLSAVVVPAFGIMCMLWMRTMDD